MATMNVKDAAGSTVAIEKPLVPGRAAAAASRPIALSTEDFAVIDGLETAIAATNTLLTTQNGYLDSVETLLAAATPAGENHLGAVGGNTVIIDVTLSLDTSAYASGDVLADTQVVTSAMRANDATGILQSITVIDQDDQKALLYIYLLSANVAMGTENSAPSISDANALEILGPPIIMAVGDYYDLGGVSIAGRDSIGKIVKPATGTRNLYVAVVNGTGAPTYTASGVKLRLGFLQD